MRARIADRARERGIAPISFGAADDLSALVTRAVDGGADALGVAGGDGSLAIVAAAAAKRHVPFICVPAGTHNHFASDLGISRYDLIGSLDAFADGLERRIDLAEVNGQPFLNNVSIGVYGDAVQRPGYRDAKLRTILETLNRVLSSAAPAPEIEITDADGHRHRSPLVVLISNNPYTLIGPRLAGSRARLDTGRLGVIVFERPGSEPPALATWTASSATVSADAPMPAGLDGEAVTLRPPVHCTIHPGALRVRISAHRPGISASALGPKA